MGIFDIFREKESNIKNEVHTQEQENDGKNEREFVDYVKRHNFKFFGVYRIVLGLIVLAVAAITALA